MPYQLSKVSRRHALPGENRMLITYDGRVSNKELFAEMQHYAYGIKKTKFEPSIAFVGGAHGCSVGSMWVSGRRPEKAHDKKLADDMKIKCEQYTDHYGVKCKFYDLRYMSSSALRELIESGEERVLILAYCYSTRDEVVPTDSGDNEIVNVKLRSYYSHSQK